MTSEKPGSSHGEKLSNLVFLWARENARIFQPCRERGVHVIHANHSLNAVIYYYSNTESVHTDISGLCTDGRMPDTLSRL